MTTIDRNNYRSGLERTMAFSLRAEGLPFEYETMKIAYTKPAKPSKYNPDFILTKLDGSPMILEGKGRFLTADRQKHLLIKNQHPDLDIRFVFQQANQKISKQSKTTYAKWCNTHGFKFSDKGIIPQEWLDECR